MADAWATNIAEPPQPVDAWTVDVRVADDAETADLGAAAQWYVVDTKHEVTRTCRAVRRFVGYRAGFGRFLFLSRGPIRPARVSPRPPRG